MAELLICRWCGARALVDDGDEEHTCLSCAGYWFARMGWVPRVPMERASDVAAGRPTPRRWTFTDSAGQVIAEWPPPAEDTSGARAG